MCGRFTLTRTAEEVLEAFELSDVPEAWEPRFNIAPTQDVLIITGDDPSVASWARWGLIPGWATDPQAGARKISARAESLAEKASYREAFERRRCLVPADGFIEWVTTSVGKTPIYFKLKDHGPFTFAGLWGAWRSPQSVEVVSCAIVTVEANDDVSPVHRRMPLILGEDFRALWLRRDSSLTQLRRLLEPPSAGSFESFALSPSINSPANDDPSCLAPAQLELKYR